MPDETMPGAVDTFIPVTIPDMHVNVDSTRVHVTVETDATGPKRVIVERTAEPHRIEWLVTDGPNGVLYRHDNYDLAVTWAMAYLRRQIVTQLATVALNHYVDTITGG